MLRSFASFSLFAFITLFATASIAAYPPPPDDAEKAAIKKQFEEWFAKTNAEFETTWKGIEEAEAAAEPSFAAGVKLAESGKLKKAEKSLLKARSKLFNAKTGGFIHVDKGLALKIAIALAEIYDKQDAIAKIKREIVVMREGRPWMAKEEEQKVFMRKALRELRNLHSTEEAKTGRKRMKTKERKNLFRVMRYLVVGGAIDIIFAEGHDLRKSWDDAVDAAKKTRIRDTYDDFGGQGDLQAHDPLMTSKNFEKGENVLVINRAVTSMKGRTAVFNFKMARDDAYGCQNVGKPLKVTNRGRFVYKQKCKYKKVKGGHRLNLTLPKGLRLKKGDLVTTYVVVKKVRGDDVFTQAGAVVHSARKGKTQWLLGAKTKKPSFIKADGDYMVRVKDDANAPVKGR